VFLSTRDVDLTPNDSCWERANYLDKLKIWISLFFSRNLNTGGHNEMETEHIEAEQKIFHSKKYPSHILLPVIDLNKNE
jgi:hypothetical protein